MNRYILLGLFYAATASALVPMDAAYYQADVLTQWTDSDPALPQALSSSDPKDFTKSNYGCHTYVYRTAANNYNLFFTTKKPVVITEIENQQKTREIKKYNHIKKYRSEKRTRQVQKTRKVNKVRTVTKTREVWKTKQVPKVIYPVEKTRYVRKTRTVYAPSWWWAFGMGWYSWEEEYWGPETHTTFEIKYVDQRYRDTETYEEQEPYTDIETYTVTEPYWHLETYIDPEPYTVTETYTESVAVKKVIAKDCKQRPDVANLINYIGTEKYFRFVFETLIGIVAKASKINDEQTEGLLSYRIIELAAVEPISPAIYAPALRITDGNNYKQKWSRLYHIHIKKLVPQTPMLHSSLDFKSINLAWNNTKYTDDYAVEVAYNGNAWQTLTTINKDRYVFPYNSQWNLDKTQIRIKACRDNGNTCSQSNSHALSDVITNPIAADKYLLAIANTSNTINLAQNNVTFRLTGLPAYGQASIDTNGTLTYRPTTDYLGVDELGYKIKRRFFSEKQSTPATISIEVIDCNEALIADKINGNTQAIDAIKQIISINNAKGWVELEDAKKQAEKLAKNALIEANQALAAAKQEALVYLGTAVTNAEKADNINGDTQATTAISSIIDAATTLADIEAKKTQAITQAENALDKANQALTNIKQQTYAKLTVANSNAARADKINGTTETTDAIRQLVNTAKNQTEIKNKKIQASALAQQTLIEAHQTLAAFKEQAITSLTSAKSEAARINKIRGNTKATDAVKNLINSATTIAELEFNKTQAIKTLGAWDAPVAYEYDELSRLIKVVIPHQELEINYTYDAMGNRLTRYSQLLSE